MQDPEREIRAGIDRLCPDGPLGVAVSGGGDSLALLAIAAAAGRAVHAATVDHGLRPEARAEAEAVAAFCRGRGIPHAILTATGLTGGGNISARAREARYRLMSDWARDARLAAVLLGHTLDDQAETVLMRLGRGSGVDGLSAMAPVRDWLGVRWVRPMLGVRRAALRDWLGARGIGWIDDPTNEDRGFDRVRTRHAMALLAPLGITAEGLAETARRLAAEREVLEAAAADLAARALRQGALGELYLDRAALGAALPATARRLVGGILVRVAGATYPPRARSLALLLEALTDADFNGATLAGCLMEASLEEILFCREPAACPVRALEAGVQVWDTGWELAAPASAGAFWIGPLGTGGLAEATRRLREAGAVPPEPWRAAPAAARRAVPALYSDPGATPESLAAVPSAGLVLAPELAGATSRPPAHHP